MTEIERFDEAQQERVKQLEARIKELESAVDSAPAGESGFSMNWQMTDKNGVQVSLTMRSASSAGWPSAMFARHEFTEKALAAGWKFPEPPKPAPLGVQPPTNGEKPQAGYYWKMDKGALALKNGKMQLALATGVAEPEKLVCPRHDGQTLKRRSNDKGAWMSHKDGEDYCSAVFVRE